jgi:hypothetical protein
MFRSLILQIESTDPVSRGLQAVATNLGTSIDRSIACDNYAAIGPRQNISTCCAKQCSQLLSGAVFGEAQ